MLTPGSTQGISRQTTDQELVLDVYADALKEK